MKAESKVSKEPIALIILGSSQLANTGRAVRVQDQLRSPKPQINRITSFSIASMYPLRAMFLISNSLTI